MLVDAFPKLGSLTLTRLLRKFYRSAFYPALIALLMACSELFGLELAVFYIYLVFGAIGLLFDRDALCIFPIAFCSYMTIAGKNNPGYFPETTVFKDSAFIVHFVFILCVTAILLLARLITAVVCGKFEKKKFGFPRFLIGFVALGLAYVLGGVGTEKYTYRTALFGLLQIVSMCALYFYFYYTVDWQNTDKTYVPIVALCLGIGLVAEIVAMYVGIDLDNFERLQLFTGWGVYNNVGALMAMCIPSAFYFAATRKNGWGFSALGMVFFAAVLLTQSRGSIVFGFAVLCASILFALICVRKGQKWKHVAVLGSIAIVGIVLCGAFRDYLKVLYESMLQKEWSDAGRFRIYEMCFEKFRTNPFFGVGFYETPGALFHNGNSTIADRTPDGLFMPMRAHNTYMQLLTTGGVFAIVCYFLHRLETLVILFRRPSKEKFFVALTVLALILTSLLDCHFFNFGPAIIYGLLLVYAEGEDKKMRQRNAELRAKRAAEAAAAPALAEAA